MSTHTRPTRLAECFSARRPCTAHHDVFFHAHKRVVRFGEPPQQIAIERFHEAHVGDRCIDRRGGCERRVQHRPERDADHPVIAEVVRAAFVRHPDEVASFVERIRASEQFIPELALVAEDSSGVIAHVMLSWVGVEGGSRTRILNLTPMSVRPDRQRIGVGARLIRDALGRAEEAGEPAVMVEGIPAYYPRFGFEQASALGFISPHPKIPDDAFMVKRLPGYSPDLAGRIVYPAAFDALGY